LFVSALSHRFVSIRTAHLFFQLNFNLPPFLVDLNDAP
jgi:hypothetical protein